MAPFGFVERLGEEVLGGIEEGGVVVPKEELRVEEDFAVGMVPLFDSSADDPLEEPCVLKLAFDRRRRSLKNGMANGGLSSNRCRQHWGCWGRDDQDVITWMWKRADVLSWLGRWDEVGGTQRESHRANE